MLPLDADIRQRLFRGAGWALWGKVAASAAALLSNILLARLLPPDQIGTYFLAVSVLTVVLAFTELGFRQSTVRLVAVEMAAGSSGSAGYTILRILGVLIAGLVLGAGFLYFGGGRWMAVSVFHSSGLAAIMGLIAVWVLVEGFREVLAEAFRGLHDIRLATLVGESLPKMALLGLLLLWWATGGDRRLDRIVLLSMLASALALAAGGLVLRRRLRSLPAGGAHRPPLELLKLTLPLWITHITLYILTQADIWVLGIHNSDAVVAVYGAAAKLVIIIGVPLLVVNSVVAPLITELHTHNRLDDLERTLRTSAAAAFVPAGLAFLFLVVFGRQALGILYGEYYREGYWVLIFLLLGQLFNVWAGPCGLLLVQTGYQTSMMVTTMFSGLLALGGSLLLVGRYGAPGVALAACLGMITQNILMLAWARRNVGIWTHAGLRALWTYAAGWIERKAA
jgi:O-antigen/teichoic acid export membrane protein